MENQVKYNVAKMKADIKAKAEEQRFLNNQKKTVHIVGERKIEASDAAYKHSVNTYDLRILYAAYGQARGKNFSRVENHYPQEGHPLHKHQRTIDRILEGYVMPVEVPVLE